MIEAALKSGKLIIGYRSVLKLAKKGVINTIIVSSTSGNLKSSIESLTNLKVDEINLSSKELGVMCKKAFNIAVLGVKK